MNKREIIFVCWVIGMLSIVFLFIMFRGINLFSHRIDGPEDTVRPDIPMYNETGISDPAYNQVEMMYDTICDTSTQYCEPALAE